MNSSVLRFGALLAVLAISRYAEATTYTWTGGGGNDNWSTPGNWSAGVPVGIDTTDLVFGGNTNLGTLATPLNQNIANPFLLNSLTFSAGGGPFFLGGNAFQFNDGIS